MSSNITLNEYLDKLAAKSPVPGGGSAAALTGALGVSLLSMAGRYIMRHKSVRISRRRISNILKFTESSRVTLRKLMIEDELAYSRIAKMIKKPGIKDITKRYKNAAEVPLRVCMVLEEGLKVCEELCKYCRAPLISDLAEAAVLLEAGFMSAKFNVDINLIGIGDTAYTKKINSALSKSKTKALKAKIRILKEVAEKLLKLHQQPLITQIS